MDKMKILAIDDNTVNLATLEQELKTKYEVIPMISGRRAIKYLYRETVDLILLDVQMPIMDGIETLKEIRTQENGVTVPVIFLTAKKDKTTVLEGAKLGIMDYITKPFDPQDLHERIERVFKRLGVLPMEEEELYTRVKAIYDDLKTGKIKQAVMKVEEVLNYQIDEEMSGRIRSALNMLKHNELDDALLMVQRVVEFLEKKVNGTRGSALPIAESDISVRILYAVDDLENFKRKEAVQKLRELQKYDVGAYVYKVLGEVIDMLGSFDEVRAEKRLRVLLEELKLKGSSELSKESGANTGRGAVSAGYHSSINS